MIFVGLYEKKLMCVNGYWMVYVEVGKGDFIVFFYGNFIFLYFWCNIIFYVEGYGWCIVFDLIGMGDFDKLKRKLG